MEIILLKANALSTIPVAKNTAHKPTFKKLGNESSSMKKFWSGMSDSPNSPSSEPYRGISDVAFNKLKTYPPGTKVDIVLDRGNGEIDRNGEYVFEGFENSAPKIVYRDNDAGDVVLDLDKTYVKNVNPSK